MCVEKVLDAVRVLAPPAAQPLGLGPAGDSPDGQRLRTELTLMADDSVSLDQPRDLPAYLGLPLLFGPTHSHLLLEIYVGCALFSVTPTALSRRKPCRTERLMRNQSQEHQANAVKATSERPAGLIQSQMIPQ